MSLVARCAVQADIKVDSLKALCLVKGLSASQSNLERCPSSRKSLPGSCAAKHKELKKALLDSPVINWLAHSSYNRKDKHEIPCIPSFLCSLTETFKIKLDETEQPDLLEDVPAPSKQSWTR